MTVIALSHRYDCNNSAPAENRPEVSLISKMATLAPSFASRSTVAYPIPDAPPASDGNETHCHILNFPRTHLLQVEWYHKVPATMAALPTKRFAATASGRVISFDGRATDKRGSIVQGLPTYGSWKMGVVGILDQLVAMVTPTALLFHVHYMSSIHQNFRALGLKVKCPHLVRSQCACLSSRWVDGFPLSCNDWSFCVVIVVSSPAVQIRPVVERERQPALSTKASSAPCQRPVGACHWQRRTQSVLIWPRCLTVLISGMLWAHCLFR